MNKKSWTALALTVAAALLLPPGLVIAYAIVFGHSFTTIQGVAAFPLASIGVFVAIAAAAERSVL